MMTKAGRLAESFRLWKNIPVKINIGAYKKASKFEKGLSSFVERTVKRALGAFKNEYEEGQASKKSAVIQLIECTMGGQKKLYNRWRSMTEKSKLMSECKLMTGLFQTLNYAIKSVADNVFLDNKESSMK